MVSSPRIVITDSNGEITRQISKQLVPQILKKMRQVTFKRAIKGHVKVALAKHLEAHPTWRSLTEYSPGSLLAHLGLPKPNSMTNNIKEAWLDTIDIQDPTLRRSNASFLIRQNIVASRLDHADIIGNSNASYISVNSKGHKKVVPWLDWLLFGGTQILIPKYRIDLTLEPEQKKRSRTGLALMIRGGTWSMPPEYSGTKGNNMLTEVIDNAMSDVLDAVEKAVIQHFYI
jgi:hypothetical protein